MAVNLPMPASPRPDARGDGRGLEAAAEGPGPLADGEARQSPADPGRRDPVSASPVPWIASLEPAVHGGPDLESGSAFGPDALDFSANGNVIGPPPGALQALREVDVRRYPDRASRALREAIAGRHGLGPDQVLVGNGSTELIWAAARCYLGPGRRALVVGPTYGEYAVASRAAGAEVVEWRWPSRAPQPRHLPGLGQALESLDPSVVWLCHPNNPTGQPFPLDELPALLARTQALAVVDEAYQTLAEGLPTALPLIGSGRVVVLRSLTKDLGLAGARLGYAVAPAPVAAVIRRALPPWNVSSLAQAAGLAALADPAHLDRARAAVAESRAHLWRGLKRLGLRPLPSVANFVLVPVGSATQVARSLAERGLIVRDCTSFGLPDCIRIGVRSIPHQERLLEALECVLASLETQAQPGSGSAAPRSRRRRGTDG